MGTRGIWGFVLGEQEKLTYNQFDSYPDGLGEMVWGLCRDLGPEGLRDAAERMRLVDQSAPPTAEDIERYQQWTTWRNGRTDPPEWYDVLYNTHGDPQAAVEAGAMEADGALFALDSLFCEWGYVVDLNEMRLEVYEGFRTAPHERGRFAKRTLPDGSRPRAEYWPIEMIASFPLDALPESAQAFTKAVTAKSRYPEDEEPEEAPAAPIEARPFA